MTATDGLYVYGVVPGDTSPGLFADVDGIGASGPIRLVEADGVAAIASAVSLAEFDAEALERNLRDPSWLEQKVRAHDRVLAAVVGRATVLPLRFGAIYRSEDHVRSMLADRPRLGDDLARLEGLLEFGVKAFLDTDGLAARLRASQEPSVAEGGGRAYMLRKQFERSVDGELRTFAAGCAEASHERLAAACVDARVNPTQPRDVAGGDMILNGAYLAEAGREPGLRSAVRELQDRYGPDGVSYELTGPWPPYNFAEDEEPA
jgi:hypothetical protein